MAPALSRRLKGWAFDLALLVAILFAAHLWNSRGAARGPAPALAGPGADGRPLSLAALQGKPTLVHFWATWCPVCKQEEGNVAALARDHQVLTVATDSGAAAEVQRYLHERGVDFPVLVDADQALSRAYGVRAFPTSFYLSPDGQIRFVEVGYTSSLGMRLRLWLAGR